MRNGWAGTLDLVERAQGAELDHWRKLWRAQPRTYERRYRACMTRLLVNETRGR